MMISPSTELRPKRRRTSPRSPKSQQVPSTSTPRRWPRVDSRSPTTPRKLTSFQEPRETKEIDHKPLEVVAVEEAAEVEEEKVAKTSHSDQTPVDKLPPTRMVSKSPDQREVETEKISEERTVIENPAWEEVLSSQVITEKSQLPRKVKLEKEKLNQNSRRRRRSKSQSKK
jgi:hypothetical protein